MVKESKSSVVNLLNLLLALQFAQFDIVRFNENYRNQSISS